MKSVILASLLVLLTSNVATTGARRVNARTDCMDGDGSPLQWVAVEKAGGASAKRLVFAVKHNNIDVLDSLVEDVSNPDSARYGNYLSLEELGDIIRNQEGHDAVRHYLLSHGVSESEIETTKNGEVCLYRTSGFDDLIVAMCGVAQFITVRTLVDTAERLLNASFYVFRHDKAPGKRLIRTEAFTIPAEIESHVDFVGGTVELPAITERMYSPGFLSSDLPLRPIMKGFATPKFIYDYYNIPDPIVKSQKATQSVFEAMGEQFGSEDLELFQRSMGLGPLSVPSGILC
jgi:hypothetical protein